MAQNGSTLSSAAQSRLDAVLTVLKGVAPFLPLIAAWIQRQRRRKGKTRTRKSDRAQQRTLPDKVEPDPAARHVGVNARR